MKQNSDNRRSFLKHIAGGTAVSVGCILSGKKAAARETKGLKRPDEVLYKKTDAFQKYYDSLR